MTVPKIWRKIPQYYNLIGKKCNECDSLYFPPRDICLKCGKKNLSDHRFNGKGEIVTFTVIRTQSPDPEGEIIDLPARDSPYIIAIIKLEEGPSITSEIVDCGIKDVKIGKKVRAVFRKIVEKGEKGVIQYGQKFTLERG